MASVYHCLLVPLEQSPVDDAVLGHARELARLSGARLVLLHVSPLPAFPLAGIEEWTLESGERIALRQDEAMNRARQYLEERARDLRSQGLSAEVELALGDPVNQIVRTAKEKGADLIVMGSHAHSILGELFGRSTSFPVRRLAEAPILLVRTESQATAQ
ncbi:universal stress protein [Methylacidimicrobium sp. B4]|uniref:universal stress protein n=1 Tax=Methylacidimicrobium sp. B4 TaxID=2796139 RepID=UPI001A8FD0C1|nr:universal stress protein [Methylacidimicrobium sp. B4]QSR84273.1 universal stress protein [Methylacidimicrobium sp. B4]